MIKTSRYKGLVLGSLAPETDMIFGDGVGTSLVQGAYCQVGVGLWRFYMNSAAEEGAWVGLEAPDSICWGSSFGPPCKGNVFENGLESGPSWNQKWWRCSPGDDSHPPWFTRAPAGKTQDAKAFTIISTAILSPWGSFQRPWQRRARQKAVGKQKARFNGSARSRPRTEDGNHCVCGITRYQTGKCTLNNCNFARACAYPVDGGLACGLDHGARMHRATPHWQMVSAASADIAQQQPDPKAILADNGSDPTELMISTADPPSKLEPQPMDVVSPPAVSQHPARSLTSTSSLLQKTQAMAYRFFLDICSGRSRPLSQAVLQQGGPVLSFDILLNSEMHVLDVAFGSKWTSGVRGSQPILWRI